jgi:hypothetical protein
MFGVPDIRGRHPTGVGTNVALGGNEGDAEATRFPYHTHASDSTSTTPASDGTGGTPATDSTTESSGHTHGTAGYLNTGGPSTYQANISAQGTQRMATDTHTHNVQGQTGPRDVGHGHGHSHGSHGHNHGHGGHGHGHGHDQKKRPHLGMRWIVKAA